MTYQVKFTESNNPSKTPIIVQDQSLNTQTSMTFVGQNYSGYAPILASDLLHLLENFANSTAPSNPVEGQIWYDNLNNILRVWDGTTWVEAGSIKKAGKSTLIAGTPAIATSTAGDLWVDTDNSQLYLYSGSNWLLVGPQYSAGAVTGPIVENIVDSLNVAHNVISLYASSTNSSYPNRVAIISQDAFTPKLLINGFAQINPGINIYTTFAQTAISGVTSALWGTASSAASLISGGKPIAGDNFLRSDSSSNGTMNTALYIKTDSGISIGSNLGFRIASAGPSTNISNSTAGGLIRFSLTNSIGTSSTVVTMSPDGVLQVGGTSSTTSSLQVYGPIQSLGTASNLTIESTTDTSALGLGSFVTAGGASIAKKIIIGDDATINGQLYLNWNDNGTPKTGAAILPNTTGIYDIGSAALKFRNIYAQSFVGSFNGQFTGALAGSVNGSAAKLASPTIFSITGDVISTNTISFDGQSAGGTAGANGTAVFSTALNTRVISGKTQATDSQLTDEFLINRPGSLELLRMSKTVLLNHVATVPIGSILPYAGITPPTGYLFCDGSEVDSATYSLLFNIIGYRYKTATLLFGSGTFALPDLRGRFPLGADNMNNGLTVPEKTNPATKINAGGGTANRVADTTANIVGAGAGIQNVIISTSNLPDHKHSLNTGSTQYYAVGIPNPATSDSTVKGFGLTQTGATGQGFGLPNSSGVISATTSQPLNTMNPYQTINYIIFTGVL